MFETTGRDFLLSSYVSIIISSSSSSSSSSLVIIFSFLTSAALALSGAAILALLFFFLYTPTEYSIDSFASIAEDLFSGILRCFMDNIASPSSWRIISFEIAIFGAACGGCAMPRVWREYAEEEDVLKVELMGMAIMATAGALGIAAAFLIN